MTAPATTRRAGPFVGNGATTSFPFTFKVFATSDIAVTKTSAGIDTVLALGGDYSVALNADQGASPGGTITYPVSGTPLAVGETLVAVGSLPYDQTADLPSGGNYRAVVIENALDRTVMQVQQLAEELGRSLTLPASAAGADTELPAPEANKVIGWNETADGLVNLDASDLASVVVAGTAYTDIFSGTGAQTAFTLTANPGSVNALDVAISGVSQVNSVDFTVSGTTLTFTSAPPAATGNIAARYVAAVPVGSANAQDVVYLAAGTSATSRTVKARLDAVPMVGDFATLALAAASGRASLTLEAGTYAVASNLTVSVPVHAMPGVLIVPAASVTVTFAAGFDAGIYQVFDCAAASSAIAFSPATTRAGYAEWWGATPNVDSDDARTANVAAINAALVALTRTELLPADYYTDAKLLHAVRGHELVGANCHSFGGTQGFVTNVYCNSPTETMLQIGPDTYPGSINAMPQGIVARNVQLRRTVQPTIASAPAGLKMQYVLKATVESIFSTESIYSFEFHNTVACRVDRCEARRSLVGAGGGTDIWYGYYCNGDNSTVGWGLPGGNASLYLSYSNASCNEVALQLSGSSGFYLDQQFTDIFMSWCEAGDCETGINVQGNSATGSSTGNVDLHISRCVLDTVRKFGVLIKNLAASGMVDIEGLYCAPSSAAVSVATAALYVQDSAGSVNVIGGQLLLNVSTVARGVVVDNSSGVSVVGTQITEATATPVLLATAKNCNIRPIVNNAGISGPGAVSMSGTCTGNVLAPIVKGKAGAFATGITVAGTGDSRNTYDVGGIDSACITGGYANKCVRNGSTALSSATMVPTYSGTNLVTGCAG